MPHVPPSEEVVRAELDAWSAKVAEMLPPELAAVWNELPALSPLRAEVEMRWTVYVALLSALHPGVVAPCRVCGAMIVEPVEGVAYDPEGRWIHPHGTDCYEQSWSR